ncbi:unnamed protein product, partial [Phaeothamnion confervicola]
MDVGTLGALNLAHKLAVPFVVNSPVPMADLSSALPAAGLPAWGSALGPPRQLLQRCYNVVFPRLLSAALTPAFVQLNRARGDAGLPLFEAQDAVFRGARVIVNTVAVLDWRPAVDPLVEMTGPLLPPAVARLVASRPLDAR